MTNLANVLNENVSFTANGMPALGSTTSDVLDFFSTISTMRQKQVHQIETSYQKAINENFALAIKLAFYTRSIRNLGQGERNVGRILFKYLANNYSDIILNNFDNIPYYGRFDDFYTFVGTKLEKEAFKYLYEQIKADLNEEYPSLCAKWLISANLKTTKKKYGILTAKYFMYFETNDEKYLNHLNQIELGEVLKKYRQTLSLLRKKINIVEQKLCAKDYDIDFAKLPSLALFRYTSLFMKHCPNEFSKYLEEVREGKTNINTSSLIPYDIVNKINSNNRLEMQTLWENIPDYVNGKFTTLVVADTSGSMAGKPLAVALSLAIYFAEHNIGVWHNKFITFASKPSFITLKGKDLYSNLQAIPTIIDNTNIERMFNLILNTAIVNKLTDADMPKEIIIISDMQFDDCVMRGKNYLEHLKIKFSQHNYTLPKIIFWNVSMYNYDANFHANKDDNGVLMLSGLSPTIFNSLLKSEEINPYKWMLEVLNDPYFARIKI